MSNDLPVGEAKNSRVAVEAITQVKPLHFCLGFAIIKVLPEWRNW